MPTNYIALTRQELYDMVWSEPMSSAKRCRRADPLSRLWGPQSRRPSATPDLTAQIPDSPMLRRPRDRNRPGAGVRRSERHRKPPLHRVP
jgi:hypothetical protein